MLLFNMNAKEGEREGEEGGKESGFIVFQFSVIGFFFIDGVGTVWLDVHTIGCTDGRTCRHTARLMDGYIPVQKDRWSI